MITMNDLSIKLKLLIASSAAVVLLAASGAVVYVQSANLGESLQQSANEIETIFAVQDLQDIAERLGELAELAIEHRHQSMGLRYEALSEAATKATARAREAASRTKDPELLQELATFLEQATRNVQPLVQASAEEDISIDALMAAEMLYDIASQASKHDIAVRERVVDSLQTTREAAEKPALINLGTLVLALLISIIGVGWVVRRFIVTPLQTLTGAVQAIVDEGDLTRSIDVTGRDEIGQLADSFRNMITMLREIPRILTDVVTRVSDVSNDIRSTRKEMSDSAQAIAERALESELRTKEMIEAIEELAKRTQVARDSTTQANDTDQTDEATEQAWKRIDEITRNAGKMAQHVSSAVSEVAEFADLQQREAEGFRKSSRTLRKCAAELRGMVETFRV